MNRAGKLFRVLIAVAFLSTPMISQAGSLSRTWNKVIGKEIKPDFLIVTSNYIKSRMLAELIQHHTKQPILLLPTGEEQDTMYAMRADGHSIKFNEKHYLDFVSSLNPSTVLFLGDERYAPERYQKIAQKLKPTTVVSHPEWDKVAEGVGGLFQLDKLKPQYDSMLAQLDEVNGTIREQNAWQRVWKKPDALGPDAKAAKTMTEEEKKAASGEIESASKSLKNRVGSGRR